MHPNAELLDRLYTSFRRRDAAAMAACYAPDATFADPIFAVNGEGIGQMWAMLCERGRDLVLDWRDVDADDRSGRVHWEARYTFSLTSRPVHNRIDSTFTFRDGLIATQRDRFSLWRWSRMALGPKGAALGWTPLVRNAIRAEARRGFAHWRVRLAQ